MQLDESESLELTESQSNARARSAYWNKYDVAVKKRLDRIRPQLTVEQYCEWLDGILFKFLVPRNGPTPRKTMLKRAYKALPYFLEFHRVLHG